MKWMNVFEHLQCGGAIRRKSWNEGEWIALNSEVSATNPIYLINQDNEPYELCEYEFRADDWMFYDVEREIADEELSEWKLLIRVRNKSLSLIHHYARTTHLTMSLFAESYDSIASWGENSKLKYYIAYSYIFKKFYVETTWNTLNPTLVYFTNKNVATNFIEQFKDMLEDVLEAERIRGLLFNNQEITKEEVLKISKDIDKLSKKTYH